MNILLVSFLKTDAPSGVRVHYLELARQLRLRGHRVDIVTPAMLTGLRRYAVAAVGQVLRRLGPGTRALVSDVQYFLDVSWAIDTRQPYDLVNAQDVGSAAAARRALGGRVPVLVTGHFNADPAEEFIHRFGLVGRAAGAARRWFGWLLGQTRYFASVSEYGLRLTRPLLPATARCRTIPNAIDFAALRADDARAELPAAAAGKHVLLNIGYLEARKNQTLLVEAARELRRLRTDFFIGLVGKGDDEAHLRQLIEQYDLHPHVALLGYHDPALPLLRRADLYVHVARQETFGLVLLEATAAGVPALACAVGGVPEVLAGSPEALLPPDISPAELAQRLHQLLAEPPARRQLLARQAAYATAHFDMPVLVTNTLRWYEDALRDFRGEAVRPAPALPAAATRRNAATRGRVILSDPETELR